MQTNPSFSALNISPNDHSCKNTHQDQDYTRNPGPHDSCLCCINMLSQHRIDYPKQTTNGKSQTSECPGMIDRSKNISQSKQCDRQKQLLRIVQLHDFSPFLHHNLIIKITTFTVQKLNLQFPHIMPKPHPFGWGFLSFNEQTGSDRALHRIHALPGAPRDFPAPQCDHPA